MGSTHAEILRIAMVCKRTGLSRTTVYEKINPRSRSFDETFPRPVALGARAVGWLSTALDVWVATRSPRMISGGSNGMGQ
ncbi:helix-turn-helix transcriptional regulator [Variovorax boronicumulans]|uniref:helix-turn-helix transcriptional regulator n=1 Tax=Variovorax boronicumulans TaxID=436515 RepID=UPI003391CF49